MSELSAWLLTYLVHSTLLIGGLLIALKCLDVRSQSWREALWTVALFGAPVTATVQTMQPVQWPGTDAPLFGAWEIAASAPTPPVELSANPVTVNPGEDIRSAPAGVDGGAGFVIPAAAPSAATPSAFERLRRGAVRVAAAVSSSELTLGVLAISALLVAWLLRSLAGLAHRRPLTEGPLRRVLDRLRAAHGPRRRVRLSTSTRLDSPVAFGLFRPEICVPVRAVTGLDAAQQEAMLAHELAHIVRNDPLRLLLARLIESVFFFQPLNRVARRRLFETVERRCDAWALARIERGLPLAECLAEVASWIHERRAPFGVAAMAERGSPLARRIEGLLHPERTLADDRRRRGLAPLAALLLPALVLAAPQVRSEAGVADRATLAHRTPVDRRVEAPPAERPDDDAVAAVAVAIDLLDEEVHTLVSEVRELRRALPADRRVDPELLRAFASVEQQIERMQTRRDRLAAWKDKVLREQGLAPTQPWIPSPRSDER